MCIFPKVLIIIMFNYGGGGETNFSQNRTARCKYTIYISPPPMSKILNTPLLLWLIIKKRVSERKPFYLLKGRSVGGVGAVGGSARRVSIRLSVEAYKCVSPISNPILNSNFWKNMRHIPRFSCCESKMADNQNITANLSVFRFFFL